MTNPTDPQHPIGVVAERTGLTPDVLRVWEKRYGVVEPKRSPGGQRLYSDADIDRLQLLHRATRGGHGISHVAGLANATLEDLVRDIESREIQPPVPTTFGRDPGAIVDQAIALTEALDPSSLGAVLRRSVARYGIVAFIDSIAAPFLRSVGDAWHAGKLTVAQEHLATAVVQRVVSETSPLLTGADGNPTIVIATLEGERHANGALMAAAIAASEGWKVIYLGADLPADEIAETAARTNASAVAISMVVPDRSSRISTGVRQLEQKLPSQSTLLIGGAGSRSLKQPNGRAQTIFADSMQDFTVRLGEIKDRSM